MYGQFLYAMYMTAFPLHCLGEELLSVLLQVRVVYMYRHTFHEGIESLVNTSFIIVPVVQYLFIAR